MAGQFSKVASPSDREIGQYLFLETDRARKQIEEGQRRLALLDEMHAALKICVRCTGSGTVCETRTDDDSPWYEPCPSCEGRGHNRG